MCCAVMCCAVLCCGVAVDSREAGGLFDKNAKPKGSVPGGLDLPMSLVPLTSVQVFALSLILSSLPCNFSFSLVTPFDWSIGCLVGCRFALKSKGLHAV
jgi:hypothetical protein